LDGRKNIEARLEPLIPPLRDLDGLVLLMISPQNAARRLASLSREVAVKLDHRRARLLDLSGINLNFVISLGQQRSQREQEHWLSVPHGIIRGDSEGLCLNER
jgi:hypothetical protein